MRTLKPEDLAGYSVEVRRSPVGFSGAGEPPSKSSGEPVVVELGDEKISATVHDKVKKVTVEEESEKETLEEAIARASRKKPKVAQ